MTSWRRPRWFSLVSVGVFEVFIHLAETLKIDYCYTFLMCRGMALDVMKRNCFKITGKFVAVFFFFFFSCHTWRMSSNAVKFLSHPIFAPDWNHPLHQYHLLPSSSSPPDLAKIILVFQGTCLLEKLLPQLHVLWNTLIYWGNAYSESSVNVSSCVYGSIIQIS